jgi:hypothetical protein
VPHRQLDRVKCKELQLSITRNIKIKPLKKRNNEIIIQYLTDPTVTKDEPPAVRFVGVSTDVRSDVKQMSKIAQDWPSLLIGKQL